MCEVAVRGEINDCAGMEGLVDRIVGGGSGVLEFLWRKFAMV